MKQSAEDKADARSNLKKEGIYELRAKLAIFGKISVVYREIIKHSFKILQEFEGKGFITPAESEEREYDEDEDSRSEDYNPK